MSQSAFDYGKYSDVFKKAQEPLQAFVDLNIKTLQNLQHMKPEEFTKVTKPEEFLTRQVEVALANGHKALEYMQNSFEIMEKAILSCVKDIRVETKN